MTALRLVIKKPEEAFFKASGVFLQNIFKIYTSQQAFLVALLEVIFLA